MCDKSNHKNDGSLQNILKSFDPYAVLEPLTPQGISKENILVDLSSNSDSNLELSGSLLEKTTKKDFEIIDVFQNLFVTPQHVKNQNIDKSTDNKDWMKAFDGIDHKNIADIDTKKELESIFSITKTNPTLTRLSDDFDDDIEEILTMKRIENAMISQNTATSNIKAHSNTKEATEKEIEIDNKNVENNNKIDENEKFSNYFISKKTKKIQPIKPNNILIIKTIKLDKKKLQKKIVLPEHEKLNYTKGPDLVEKSIALPSIIERIKSRDEIIDNIKCLKHRLILEPDNVTFIQNNIIGGASYKFEPEVLIEDCNKQRLTALHAGRAFEKFVTGEK